MTLTTTNQNDDYFSLQQKDCIKNLICKGITDDEMFVFSEVCKRTGLDPFAKQIYAIKRAGVMNIQTSIDGYRLVAERSKRYSPGNEPTYNFDKNGSLVSVTAYVKKLTSDGTWHTVAATAFYDEYCQRNGSGQPVAMWGKMPRQMLAKCAEALAIKKCFPADLSGIYTEDEMAQADNGITANDKKIAIEIPSPHIRLPSAEDVKMLMIILSKCPKEFVEAEKQGFKYKGFGEMPLDEFNQLLERARDAMPAIEVE
jgi:phage recombination protein Bet